MRASSGQSTVEYTVLVLLALVVLGAGATMLARTGIAESVVAQIRRALCLVAGGDCADRPRRACVVAVRTSATDLSARLAVLRLRGGRTVIRETRADGTERITVVQRGGLGVGVSVGGSVSLGSTKLGAEADATAEGRLAKGRSWVVGGRGAGDELLRRLAVGVASGRAMAPRPRAARPAPPPDVVFGERGLDTELAGRLGRVGLSLDAEDVLGTRSDRRTGERTLTFRRRNDLGGSLGLLGPAGAEALMRREQRFALTVDRAGRPLALEIAEVLRAHAGGKLPRRLRSLLAATGLPTRGGAVWETERRLNLTEPLNLAAAGAFVRALRDPAIRAGEAVVVTRALRERLEVAGEAEARVYELDARQTAAGGKVAAVVTVGGEYEHLEERLTLRSARIRAAGGGWQAREDCLHGGLA